MQNFPFLWLMTSCQWLIGHRSFIGTSVSPDTFWHLQVKAVRSFWQSLSKCLVAESHISEERKNPHISCCLLKSLSEMAEYFINTFLQIFSESQCTSFFTYFSITYCCWTWWSVAKQSMISPHVLEYNSVIQSVRHSFTKLYAHVPLLQQYELSEWTL
jgi:hypothetical protein